LNETLTHERIRDAFRRFSEIISNYNGIAHEIRGDAIVVEFSRASDAVGASLDFQAANAAHNEELLDDVRPVVRVGIAIGEVVVADNTVTGEGVVLAQRIEQLAEQGGICIQGAAYETIPKRLPFEYEYLGDRQVKGFDEPVRVYVVSLKLGATIPEPDSQAQQETAAPISPDKPSIAILPFTNMSDDPEQEYFSDGLTEDLITALTLWRSFPVIARNSTFTYKGKAVDVKQIAKELGVRYILEGSVRKSRNRVRISAQLIDGKTAHHIWAQKYDRELDDIFTLQDEITQRISAVIEPEFKRVEFTRSKAKRQIDLDAWDYYLRGTAFINEFTKDGNTKARDMFRRAIDLDPQYSNAYAGIAQSYHRDLLMQCADDREQSINKALEASRRAVALDGASSIAHQVLSTAHIWRNEHGLALAGARTTVDLNPNDAIGLHGLGNKSDLAGDPEGIPRMLRAQQLNPQDPDRHMSLTFLARAYVNAREHEKAIECARLAIQQRADYPHAYFILAIALGHLGRTEEARVAIDRCERSQPGFVASRANWRPYTDEDRNQYLMGGLKKAKA
jgi:adenylate cyclase